MKNRFGSYIYVYFAIFSFYFIQIITNWPLLKYFRIKADKNFGDLEIVLRAAECYKNSGRAIYSNTVGDCVYNYGDSLLKLFNLLNLTTNALNLFGYLLILATTISYVKTLEIIVKNPSIQFQILAIFMFCSPPIWLLFERGNIDSLIFVFVVVGIQMAIKYDFPIGQILIAIVSTIKFYTFPIVIFNLLLQKNRKYLVVELFGASISFIIIARDLLTVLNNFGIPSPTFVAFGSPIVGKVLNKYMGTSISPIGQIVLGLLVLLIGLCFIKFMACIKRYVNDLSNDVLNASSPSIYLFYSMSLIYLFCFYSTMSWVFRLIFVLPIIMHIFQVQKNYYSLINIITLSGIWFSYQTFRGQIIGDAALFILSIGLIWIISVNKLNFRDKLG
jgi:hypothetical protein